MKTFTKITLIIATIILVIGVACLVASFTMGLTMETFLNMVEDGKFSFGEEDIIRTNRNKNVTMIDEECQSLDVEFEAGILEIYYDDVEQIRIEQKNVPDLEAYVEKNTLYIEGETKTIRGSKSSMVIVLPQDMEFEKVDLEIGASKANIKDVVAKECVIVVGAGEANILNLETQYLNAETGVGKLTIQLIGKESDYNYNIECGIGSIQIGENSYGGLGTKQRVLNPGAKCSMDVECGIGEIQVRFTEE